MSDQQKPVTLWVAVLVLAIFLLFTSYVLWQITSHDEVAWSRLVFVHKGLEAIALAAVGYLFGKEVHRERAEKAEERAKNAENNHREAQGHRQAHAQKLAALINLIETKHERRTSLRSSSGTEAVESLEVGREIDADWKELLSFARKLREAND
jgi:hypothetical protein